MKELILPMVKSRLGRTNDSRLDDYFRDRIAAAVETFEGEGIHVKPTAGDMMLVCDQVCWDYSNRDKNEAEPKWLKEKKKNRFLREPHDHDT